MAIVEETIGSGKDRATVALWEANVGAFGTDTYKGIIQENANFNENVTLTGGTGTPSITSYLWLTSDPANRHVGIAGTGHARMYGTGSSHIITIDSDFCLVSWLDIKQDQSGSSDEAFRINANIDDVLIQYNIIWTDSGGADQDGIYTGAQANARLRIDNNIFYGWRRAGAHIQQFGTSGGQTISVDFDHNTFDDCGVTGENESGAIFVRSSHASDAITIGCFNTWGAGTAVNAPFVDGKDGVQPETPNGTVTWNGSDNGRDDTTDHIQGTDNTTAWEDATDGIVAVTKSTGSWIVVTNLTGGSEDYTLLDDAAGNLMAGNGVDRQGSEPDARQDFSVAIDGPRPTGSVDIGASQVSTSGLAEFITEAVGVTDDTTRVHSAKRTIAEPIGVTDATAVAKAIAVAVSNVVGVIDDVTDDLVVGGQFLRPDTDLVVGGWTPTPSSPTTLFDKIDEVTASDTDYISET